MMTDHLVLKVADRQQIFLSHSFAYTLVGRERSRGKQEGQNNIPLQRNDEKVMFAS